jgi:hypothetical protein
MRDSYTFAWPSVCYPVPMHGRVSVFVDESGDTSLDLDGTKTGGTRLFVICAVIVPAADLDTVRKAAEAVRKRHFQTGEMKSSRLRGGRRSQVLKALSGIPYTSFFLVTDKARFARPGGFAYKKSFFKNLNGRLYQRIHEAFDEVDVVADQHGDETFMQGFEKYLQGRLQPELFPRRTFRFQPSQDEPLIQLADVLAGTVRRCFENDSLDAQLSEDLELVLSRSTGMLVWPPRDAPAPALVASGAHRSKHDELVSRHCTRVAALFLERTASDPDALPTRAVLEYLLFKAEFISPTHFVSTGEIRDHLHESYSIKLSEQQFRSTVIARLRDSDVILASSPKGYKVPVSVQDLRQYVGLADRVIPPMLSRLSTARDSLRLATHGELDILDGTELDDLRELVDALNRRRGGAG